MALAAIHTSPVIEDFTLLSEHHAQTPGTFFGGKTVLHLQSSGASIKISRGDLESQTPLLDLRDEATTVEAEGQLTIKHVDVWVTSSHLTLYSATKSSGVQIPYPAITVHAQEGEAVFLGLNLSDANTADEDIVFIQLRIIPTSYDTHEYPAAEDDVPQPPNGHGSQSPAQALFKAISDCQELNPDPPEEGDEEFDETAPGATGWITSENMQDLMDENGELRIPQDDTVLAQFAAMQAVMLGEGAGRTRTAAEVDAEDGVEDETKWQRTG